MRESSVRDERQRGRPDAAAYIAPAVCLAKVEGKLRTDRRETFRHAAEHHHDLQRQEVGVDEEPHQLRRGDEQRIAGRVGMVLHHVVVADTEAEERLVPVPHGMAAREKAAGGGDGHGGGESDALTATHRFNALHDMLLTRKPRSRLSPPLRRRAGLTT